MPPKKTTEEKAADKMAKHNAQIAYYAAYDAAYDAEQACQMREARDTKIEKMLSYVKSSRNIELNNVAKMFPSQLQTETAMSLIPRTHHMHQGCDAHSGKAMVNFYTALKAALAIDMDLINKMLEKTLAIQITNPVTDSFDPDI